MTYKKLMEEMIRNYITENLENIRNRNKNVWEHVGDFIHDEMWEQEEYTGVLYSKYPTTPDEAKDMVTANIEEVIEACHWSTCDDDDAIFRIGEAFCYKQYQLLDSIVRHAFLSEVIDQIVEEYGEEYFG